MAFGRRARLYPWLIGAGMLIGAPGMGAAEKPLTETDSMNLMMKADLDKDGTLTKAEVSKLDPALVAGFEKADADKDGKLNLKELEALVAASPKKQSGTMIK